MVDLNRQDERHSADEATKPIGAFSAPRRAKTFETGGPSNQTAPKQALEAIAQIYVEEKSTYVYRDFDYHEDIRILRVLHGNRNDPLRCQLFLGALPPAHNVPWKSTSKYHKYRALSYCWGDPDEIATHELLMYEHDGIQDGLRNRPAKFYVRSNLYAALRQFRKMNEDVNLWVDALCINQEDSPKALREKTAQVARMDRVYSEAESVLVWLGEGTRHTKATFRFLQDILNFNIFDDLITTKRDSDKWKLLIQLMRNQWFSRRWVIQELALAREAIVYWGGESMMWPDFADAIALAMTKHREIKEILKAAVRKELIEADVDIPEPQALGANILVNASSNLFRRSADGHIQQCLVDLEVLVSCLFLPFEASEPRDTIYAVLSLARDTRAHAELVARFSWIKPKISVYMFQKMVSIIYEWIFACFGRASLPYGLKPPVDSRIAPDYSKSLTDVWAGFMEYCIERSDSRTPLDIICRHWAPPPKLPTWRERLELKNSNIVYKAELIPSWVPAIERHAYGPTGILNGRKNGDGLVGSIQHPNQQHYNASGGLPPSVSFGRIKDDGHAIRKKFDGTLHVKGFKIDTVGEFSGRVLDGVIPAEGLRFGGWQRSEETGEYPDRVPDVLWRTLVADRDVDGTTAPTWYRRACLECLQHTNADGDLNTRTLNTTQTMKSFVERMQAITWCRRFFLTAGRKAPGNNPWYGLGPRDLNVGDLICILFGCSVPVVLRETAKENHYTFIGECYVHGLMDGEKLPSKHQRVLKPPYEYVDGFTLV